MLLLILAKTQFIILVNKLFYSHMHFVLFYCSFKSSNVLKVGVPLSLQWLVLLHVTEGVESGIEAVLAWFPGPLSVGREPD